MLMLTPLLVVILLPQLSGSLSDGFPEWCPDACSITCTNISPSFHKDCDEYVDDDDMKPGFCCASCCNPEKCKKVSKTCKNKCSDQPPSSNYSSSRTCEAHVRSGNCEKPWMVGYCCKSCANRDKCDFVEGRRQTPCSDEPPPEWVGEPCHDLAVNGACGHPDIKGYCCLSCLKKDICTDSKVNLLVFGVISIPVLVVLVMASYCIRTRMQCSCLKEGEDGAHIIPQRPPSIPFALNNDAISYDGP